MSKRRNRGKNQPAEPKTNETPQAPANTQPAPPTKKEMKQEIREFQKGDDRFKGVGINKALARGNTKKAYERMQQAEADWQAAQATGNQDLVDSIQKTYSKTQNKGRAGQKVSNMLEQFTQMNNPGDGEETSAPPPPEIPANVNQNVTQAVQDTSADILGRAGDYLENAGGFQDQAQDYMQAAIDPNTAAFDAIAEQALQDRMAIIDQVYGIDDINNPGQAAEPYVDALIAETENIFNRGLEDSDTRSAFNARLARAYNADKAGALQGAFDQTRAEKLGERGDVRNLNSGFANTMFGQGNQTQGLASNLINMGLGNLLSSGQMNLANLGFVRDTIENNYITENNARRSILDMLRDDRFNKPIQKYIADNPELLFPQISNDGGFFSDLLGGTAAGIASGGLSMLP